MISKQQKVAIHKLFHSSIWTDTAKNDHSQNWTERKDMNKEKLNAIKYNQIVRVGVARDRRIINNYNHDTDSSEESSEEEDGDLDSQIQEQNEEPVSQSEVTETPVN